MLEYVLTMAATLLMLASFNERAHPRNRVACAGGAFFFALALAAEWV